MKGKERGGAYELWEGLNNTIRASGVTKNKSQARVPLCENKAP